MFTTICVALSLIFWFYVVRWAARLAFRNPRTSLSLLSGVARMIRR